MLKSITEVIIVQKQKKKKRVYRSSSFDVIYKLTGVNTSSQSINHVSLGTHGIESIFISSIFTETYSAEKTKSRRMYILVVQCSI